MASAFLAAIIGLGTGVTGEWAVVAAAVLGLLALLVVAPELAVLGYACTRPLADLAVFVKIGPLTVGQLWGAGLLLVMLGYWMLRFRDEQKASLVPVSLAVVYALLTLWRPDEAFALLSLVKLLSWLLLIMTVEHIAQTDHGFRMSLRSGIAAAVLVAVVMGVSIATNRYGSAYYTGELAEIGQGPHGIASMAVMSLPFLLIGAELKPRRRFLLVLVGMIGIGVLFSLVRTALIAYFLVVGALVVRSMKGGKLKALVGAVAAVLAVGVGAYFMQDLLTERLADLRFLGAGGGATVWAGGGRLGIWSGVLRSVSSGPWAFAFGAGAGSTYAISYAEMGASVWAHNDFLEFLATGGIVLSSLYCGILVWMWRSSSGPMTCETAVLSWFTKAAVVAFAFMAFFNGMAFYQASILAGLLVGMSRGRARSARATVTCEEAV